MPKRIDLTGKQFGYLLVNGFSHTNERGQTFWSCTCTNCGKANVVVRGTHLRSGTTRSCGCATMKLRKKKFDILVGQSFGKLLVVKKLTTKDTYECKCECGNIVSVTSDDLFKGTLKSCGCLKQSRSREFKDLTGQKFGMLSVINLNGIKQTSKGDIPVWHCKCDCGNEIDIRRDYLTEGITKSCGCLRHKQANNFIDLANTRFGHLVALEYFRNNHRTYWKCKCDCGRIIDVEQSHLVTNHTTSCGCISIAHKGSKAENEIRDFVESVLAVANSVKSN